MHLEFIVSLALIIALSELREWRGNRKHRQLVGVIQGIKRQGLLARADMEALKAALATQLAAHAAKSFADIDGLRSFIISADQNLQTIVNEYKINGVPLGYERKPQSDLTGDYIEGL